MAKVEKKKLERKSWSNSFYLVGEARVNDYTYKIDEKSEKSDWIYNVLNLGVFCGEKHGTVYTEMMGGYGAVYRKGDSSPVHYDCEIEIVREGRPRDRELSMVGIVTTMLEKGLLFDHEGKHISPYDLSALNNVNVYPPQGYPKNRITEDLARSYSWGFGFATTAIEWTDSGNKPKGENHGD